MDDNKPAEQWAKKNGIHVKEYEGGETGGYCNFCVQCGERFLGYKNDMFCGRKGCLDGNEKANNLYG